MRINCDTNNHTIYEYTITNAVSLSFCMVEHTQSSVSVELTQPESALPCPICRTTQFTDQQVYIATRSNSSLTDPPAHRSTLRLT